MSATFQNHQMEVLALSSNTRFGFHKPIGLYHPKREHDACGLAFVAHLKGEKSHQIVEDGLKILKNLTHRGATGYDPLTGDGAGILIQIPDAFYRDEVAFTLPPLGEYAAGLVFLPKDEKEAQLCRKVLEEAIRHCGLSVLGFRPVKTNPECLGEEARWAEPSICQIFVGRGQVALKDFGLLLYRARRRAEKAIERKVHIKEKEQFYVCSLSHMTIVYKGMFLASQVSAYYPELTDKRVVSAVAMVHQRFSTNTFPSWKLAHPFRYISHNGEVNTIQGNINQMRSREANLANDVLGVEGIEDIKPLIPRGASDSAAFDAALEAFLHTGRSLPHALAMMIPEAWGSRKHMNEDKKDFYLYHANLLEPWDGPAALAAFDGRQICAILDRNGLRPARFCLTSDDRIIFGSEAGMLLVPEKDIVYKSRLWPGKMIMVDIEDGTFMEDNEVKATFINSKPYRNWLKHGLISLEDLPDPVKPPKALTSKLECLQRTYFYTEEVLREHLKPMAMHSQEPVGAMGNDAPLAVLSPDARPLFDYFRQKFAQVTNPAIDPIREELVMGVASYFGSEWNIFEEGPDYCLQVKLDQPFLTNHQLEKLAQTRTKYLRGAILSTLMEKKEDSLALFEALEALFKKAEDKISLGYNTIILSDRNVDEKFMAIPILLAVSSLHHHLVRRGVRGNLGIIVETGEAFLPHHMAALFGYGANAVNPYLAFETLRDMRDREELPAADGNEDDYEDPCAVYDRHYIAALNKGLRKVMSKMGISTLRSYRGAQIFEAVGLSQKMVDRYFCGTVSTLDGLNLEEIYQSAKRMHDFGFQKPLEGYLHRDVGGDHRWRPQGPFHLFNPESITLLQRSVREDDYELYKAYAKKIDDQSEHLATIRGLFKFASERESLPLDKVEPIENILKRFCSGAMSLGSISPEAHETLAIAMNRIGGKSNTGEGGEDPRRFLPDDSGDLRRSAIKQVASGRFGVTPHYLVNADEIQIKVAQGAKPGEGGQLPGHKVSSYIASLRNSVPQVTLISPPPHHDIYSIEDLAQLIYDLKNVNPAAAVSVKLVSEFGVGTVAAGVAKAHAEVVIISGHDGGTGASPISSIKHAGTPWELGLSETHQTLVLNNLRSRIRVQADGQMKTGRDVVVAALLGAEEFGFATALLVAEGCIMMRKCHLDTCPVGIATQNPDLRAKFNAKADHVVRFMTFVARQVREIMATLGFATMDEMVGQVDVLKVDEARHHWKTRTMDLSKVLHKVTPRGLSSLYQSEDQDHDLEGVLDRRLISLAQPAFKEGAQVEAEMDIFSYNRSTGSMLSGKIAREFGSEGLKEGILKFCFTGSAGQSFGAFLMPGVDFRLQGEANDYLGKGMHGGLIVVGPAKDSSLISNDNCIAGNTLLYGATGGKVFLAGRAGERFAVRNSGACAVVEGVGDHGCEYMTGGVVVVLGPTGRNFAAGMSGGCAYVFDKERLFSRRCNTGMVDIESVAQKDFLQLKGLIEEHYAYTKSRKAARLLDEWQQVRQQFVKVMPREYRKVLAQKARQERRVGS